MHCSVTFGLPCFQSSQEKQTNFSVGFRITTVVLGMIGIIVGALILYGAPGLSDLGKATGWAMFPIGTSLILIGLVIKCIHPSSQTDFVEEKAQDTANLVPDNLGCDPVVVENKRNSPMFGPNLSTLALFTVEEVPIDQFAEIANEMVLWSQIAREKYIQIHGGRMPFFRSRDEEFSDIGEPFNNLMGMVITIHTQVAYYPEKRGLGGEPWDSVLICRDKDNRIQAVALYKKVTNKLAYLATHPNNIRHSLNDNIPSRVQGAGTQIMLAMMKLALITNQPILLRALEGSVPFYAKLHFERDPENVQPYDGYSHITPMKLTIEKINQLIEAGTPPFDQLRTEMAKV